MIAEAITTAHPHFTHVLVDLATIRWSNPRTGKRYVCLTPEVAARELVRFDQGEAIEPFAFSLKPIQVTERVVQAESPEEAKAAGRKTPRRTRPSKKRDVDVDSNGQPTIRGGYPLPPGHLPNAPKSANKKRTSGNETPATPEADASNVTRSGTRYRQYGRRLLQA
jgi:hypothetical protein